MSASRPRLTAKLAIVVAVATVAACSDDHEDLGVSSAAVTLKVDNLELPNPSGTQQTYSDNKNVSFKKDRLVTHPFFRSIGTNGRACVHCHLPSEGWSISAAGVAARFAKPLDTANVDCVVDPTTCAAAAPADAGLDPIFRPVDGASSPVADVTTAAARAAAYSMLTTRGLIRVGIGIPPGAEFTLEAVDDPYGYASAAELSLFRRPLPATNLRLSPSGPKDALPTPVLTGVMWDGRGTTHGRDVISDLLDQADGATLGHAQATAGLSTADRQAIVDFETGLHTAQATTIDAGSLSQLGANGGPRYLATDLTFYVGINDVVSGDARTGAPFSPDVFSLYAAWATSTNPARAQIARGEALFDRKPISITGVGGLNDVLGVASLAGSCTSCHDTPSLGHHSVPFPIDIGLTDAARRTPDMPLYTLKNTATGELRTTTDPGRALFTGRWRDIAKFKGPILRGLAARAPYFHNGLAASLEEVVGFYDVRFGIGLTAAEKADLAAFLRAL